jgi:hypothetical protein
VRRRNSTSNHDSKSRISRKISRRDRRAQTNLMANASSKEEELAFPYV